MNGIKVMFGIIGNIRYLFFVFLVGLIPLSCIRKSSNTCEWEKQNYQEKWDFVVEKTYKHPDYKATFIIETTTNKKILISPIQDIVAFSEKGDKIYKESYSKYAYLITDEGDSIRSRIFSISCDSIVENTNPPE